MKCPTFIKKILFNDVSGLTVNRPSWEHPFNFLFLRAERWWCYLILISIMSSISSNQAMQYCSSSFRRRFIFYQIDDNSVCTPDKTETTLHVMTCCASASIDVPNRSLWWSMSEVEVQIIDAIVSRSTDYVMDLRLCEL